MTQVQRIRAWITSPLALATLIMGGGLVLYGTQLTTAEMNGDAALYASQVARSDLSVLTLHAGFLGLGIVLDKLLPGPTTLALNTLSFVFGALGAGLTTWLTWRLTGSRVAGLVAGLGLLLAGNYWTHALYAEVYVVQTCLVVLAWVCWVEARSLCAGLAFLAALLVSPLSVLALPALLMAAEGTDSSTELQSTRFLGLPRPLWQRGIVFGLAWIPAYGLFVWLNRQEFFHRHGFVAGSWRYDLPYSLAFLGFSFLFLWPLIAVGVLLMLRRSPRRYRLLLPAITLTFAAHLLVVGRLSDHGAFFLPIYPLAAVLAGVGSRAWLSWHIYPAQQRRQWLGITVGLGLLIASGGALALTFPQFAQHARRYLGEFDTSLIWLYPIAAVATVAGWGVVRRLGIAGWRATAAAVVVLLLAWQGITSQALMVSPQARQTQRIQQISMELEALRSTDSLVIATWSQGALYEYYTTGRVARQGWWEIKEEVTKEKLQAALRQYDQVWLIHPYSPDLLRENGIDPDGYQLQAVRLPSGVVWRIREK